MISKKARPPTTQRHFATPWGELDYLCKKVRYWLYTRGQRNRAERYLDRLEKLLDDLAENDVAILRQEGLALLHEVKRQFAKAIAHRKREIQLMEQLHGDARSPDYSDSTRAYMLRDRDASALQERRTILRALEKAKAQRQTADQYDRDLDRSKRRVLS